MLAADKLQLQSALKQQATALKEKEFILHHSNLMTVGTQAAVLAGLDITMFIEFNPPHDSEWVEDMKMIPRVIKFIYYITIVSAFCANMLVVSHTTALSVLGAGLALRGPDGSMMTATDGLYEERASVFKIFGLGLGCTVGSLVLGVWLVLQWEAALVCMAITLATGRQIWMNYQRVQRRFDYDESLTVDFRDLMEGPGAIQAVPNFIGNAIPLMSNATVSSSHSHKRSSNNAQPFTPAPSSAGASFFNRRAYQKSSSAQDDQLAAADKHVSDDDSEDMEVQMTPQASTTAVQRRRGGGSSPAKAKTKQQTMQMV